MPRSWKRLQLGTAAKVPILIAQLASKDGMITALETRILPLELELAILAADRGRPLCEPRDSEAAAAVDGDTGPTYVGDKDILETYQQLMAAQDEAARLQTT